MGKRYCSLMIFPRKSGTIMVSITVRLFTQIHNNRACIEQVTLDMFGVSEVWQILTLLSRLFLVWVELLS
jgi:hypothetical protein